MNTAQLNSVTAPTALSPADLEQAQGGLFWLIPVVIVVATAVDACDEGERVDRAPKGAK